MASAHPPLSMHTAHLLALGFSITYVGSLYVAKNARIRVNAYDARLKFQPGGRDDPAVIRARLMAVTIACVLSCGVVYYLLVAAKIQDPMVTTMRLLGVQWPPSVLSCLQTPLLFIGPIYGHYLASALPGQKHYSFKYHFVDTFFSWVGFRNYLWAPLTEEITFRACVLSVYAMGGASRWKMIAFAPLVFGLAHVHHGWEVYKQLGSTPAAFNRALVSAGAFFRVNPNIYNHLPSLPNSIYDPLRCLRVIPLPPDVLLVRFTAESHPPHPRIFNLLAECSHRWETADFFCSLKGVDTSALRGRLPRLKDFENTCEVRLNHCKPVVPLDFLGAAPCLNRIVIPVPLLHPETFMAIRKQINILSLIVMPLQEELHTVLRLASDLPDAAQLCLSFDLDPSIMPRNWDPALSLPSITSSLKALGCRVLLCSADAEAMPHHLSSVFSQLFDSLTLPNLEGLYLGYEAYPRFTLSWAGAQHSTFLGLCDRSGFGRCLKTLRVSEVRVSEQQLVEILSLLNVLERLEVGDSPTHDDLPVITDSFLHAMTTMREDSGNTLVPSLAELSCLSRLAFTPEAFLDFVVSRLTNVGAKFQVSLYPAANSDAEVFLEPTVHTLLRQLAVDHRQFYYLSDKQHRPMEM